MPQSLKSQVKTLVKAAEKGLARTVSESRPKVRRLRKQMLRAERKANRALSKAMKEAKPVLQRRMVRLRKGVKVASS